MTNRELSKRFVFLLGFFVGFATRCLAAPAIPAAAAELAARDFEVRGKNQLIYYLWSPTASDRDYNAASATLNAVVNQGSCDYVPPRIANGALIMFDLEQLVDNSKQIEKLQYLLARVPSAYFFETIVKTDKANKSAKFILPAHHTGAAGEVLGLSIFRVDQFCKLLNFSIDDGLYYQFRGLKAGETKLDPYLESRGFSRKNAKAANAVDELLLKSMVTGSTRAVFIIQGQQTKASVGGATAMITGDVFAGPLDPRKNVFKSIFNEDFDAFEVIITLPSGYQEFTVWDGKGTLLAEAAQRVVTDHTTPQPFPNRLHTFSCISCHSERDGFQQLVNEQRLIIQRDGRLTNEQGTITFNADVTQFYKDPIEGKRVALSRFGARQHDIDAAIDHARECLNRRFDVVNAPRVQFDPKADLQAKAHSCKQAYLDLTAVVNAYSFKWVSPEVACQELGFETDGNPRRQLGLIAPPPNKKGYVSEGSANTIGQLLAGNSVTRDDFEQAYPELELKAVDTLRRITAGKRLNFNVDRHGALAL